ncbi:PP2C family protein-serine/threonine phosphatase [Streptacidiphilus sp. EB129]|uniref:PP2C family protein-serine/threonine phosphatase n=1 Tax=Streptacidiphilus sp. EB129 TaxID=3156262 RepID=UPI003516FB7E
MRERQKYQATPVPADGAALLKAPLLTRLLPPVAAMGFVSVLDVASGPNTYLASLMSVVPPLAALTLYPLELLAASTVGILLLIGLSRYDGMDEPYDTRLYYGTLISYVALTAASAMISRLRVVRTRHLVAVSTVAEAAQLALLRPPEPTVGDIRLAARYVSAADSAKIGGDLYGVLDTPYGVRAIIGDVRGKGLGAVHTAAVVLGAFREAAYDERDLVGVARRLEASVLRHVPSGEFTTALLVGFGEPRTVELVHCGHVAPLRISPDGTAVVLDPPDPWVPLGLAHLAEGVPLAWRVPFRPGDVLLLCTDGVVEARPRLMRSRSLRHPRGTPVEGAFYPLAERAPALVTSAGRDLDEAVARVYADLVRHAGGALRDDAALLLLARDPAPRTAPGAEPW